MTDYELLSPWAQMHKDPPPLIWMKVGANGGREGGGPPPENVEGGGCDIL